MKVKENRYIKLCHSVLKALGKARTPLRGSKYSNKLYTVHQHCVLLVLRERERKPYRNFTEWLKCCD